VTDLVSRRERSDSEQESNVAVKGGLLLRIISKRATATSRRSKIIQLAQIPIVLGLVLCIIGSTDAASLSNASDIHKGPTYTKVGVVIFLAGYILLIALVTITIGDVGEAPPGERRLYWVIVAAIPFLGVRLLWSLIAIFSHDSKFKITGGNEWINFGMAVVEEFIIVCMYTITGLTLGNI
jgi:vacuolar-type H+-ATPase subunit I/STV1